MATYEKKGQMTYKDEDGNLYLLHPKTKMDCVDGLEEALTSKRPNTWMPSAADVGARPNTWTPTAADVGARPNTWTPTAADVGARPNTWTPTAADVGARPNTWTPTAADVGAVKKSGDTMTGWLGFDGTVGPEWITADGTRFAVRAYKDGNLFQVTATPPGGSEIAAFNIRKDGSVYFGDAAAARSSLGITPANIGAAPAVLADMVKAFGINTNYILDVQNSNFDTLTTNGIYKGLKGSATGFPDQLGEWAFVLNLSYDDGGQFGVQFAWDMIGYTICHRYKRDGTWNAWKTPNLIQTHQFWADNGKAAAGTFSMVGYHIVTNYGNGLFRVLFHGSSQTIAADTFEYGVRADWLLNNINATFGTSFTGISHKSSAIDAWRYDNGSYAKDGAGFGYCFQERHTSDAFYLVPARVHTSAGNVGQWALNSINNYWGADAMVNYELWLQLS